MAKSHHQPLLYFSFVSQFLFSSRNLDYFISIILLKLAIVQANALNLLKKPILTLASLQVTR
ncbi:hypothetical protein [Photobacterium leiognathi]|uniref:hypothetical protein n=1 Tax=Photobacterium leiognathi TaxID=553611 RepID=UPI0027324416|nr:hypothetical protein [Photobacterium leiognathi]